MLIQFNSFLPVYLLDAGAVLVVIIIALALAYKLRRWTRVTTPSFFKDAKANLGSSGLAKLFLSELVSRVLAQKELLTDSRARRATHLMIFWGFIGLAFATVWDDLFFHDGALPEPLSSANFGNLVGNVAGALLLAGMTIVIVRYVVVPKFRIGTRGDLVFLGLLYFATITGFLTEFSRSTVSWFAYGNYGLHLVLVAALFLTAPFTHFFHSILTPFMRYVERVQIVLAKKGVARFPYYRKIEMATLAENVRTGDALPTYPDWLDKQTDSA
jgi:nitrate reductase gamma subunit